MLTDNLNVSVKEEDIRRSKEIVEELDKMKKQWPEKQSKIFDLEKDFLKHEAKYRLQKHQTDVLGHNMVDPELLKEMNNARHQIQTVKLTFNSCKDELIRELEQLTQPIRSKMLDEVLQDLIKVPTLFEGHFIKDYRVDKQRTVRQPYPGLPEKDQEIVVDYEITIVECQTNQEEVWKLKEMLEEFRKWMLGAQRKSIDEIIAKREELEEQLKNINLHDLKNKELSETDWEDFLAVAKRV